jgi:hypothetical protein
MDELEDELYGAEETELKPPQSAIEALLEGVGRRALLDVLKRNQEVTSRLFRGFKVGAGALANPLVRQRLAEEVEGEESLRDDLLASWRDHVPELCAGIAGASVGSLRRQLPALVEEWGGGAVWLSLAGDPRKTAARLLRQKGLDWAQPGARKTVEGDEPAQPGAPPEPEPPPDPTKADGALLEEREELRTRNAALNKEVTRSRSVRDQAQSDAEKWQRECEAVRSQLSRLQDENRQSSRQLARCERKLERLEQENERLEREVRRLRRGQTQPPEPGPRPETQVVVPPPPVPRQPARAKAPSRVPGLVWQDGPRRFSIPLEEVLKAVHLNNVSLVREWAQSLRSLGQTDREGFMRLREALARESEYCAHVLTKPTQGVVVDGSNVCHYERHRTGKAKLSNLLAARDELRERRFFPILIQADASLPYQIDEPGKLAELVERGEIRMVVAGTSADDQITRVARDQGYYVVTNDRGLTQAIDPELELPVIAYSIEQGYFYCHEL